MIAVELLLWPSPLPVYSGNYRANNIRKLASIFFVSRLTAQQGRLVKEFPWRNLRISVGGFSDVYITSLGMN